MDGVVLRIDGPQKEDRPTMLLEVVAGDGAWTEGAHAVLFAGNDIELTPKELAWLVEDAGPAALAKLREEALRDG